MKCICNRLNNPTDTIYKSDWTMVEWNEWMDVSMHQETCNQELNGWLRMNMGPRLKWGIPSHGHLIIKIRGEPWWPRHDQAWSNAFKSSNLPSKWDYSLTTYNKGSGSDCLNLLKLRMNQNINQLRASSHKSKLHVSLCWTMLI